MTSRNTNIRLKSWYISFYILIGFKRMEGVFIRPWLLPRACGPTMGSLTHRRDAGTRRSTARGETGGKSLRSSMLVFSLFLSSRESLTGLCPVDACPVSCLVHVLSHRGVDTRKRTAAPTAGITRMKDVLYGIRRLRAEMQRMFRHLV